MSKPIKFERKNTTIVIPFTDFHSILIGTDDTVKGFILSAIALYPSVELVGNKVHIHNLQNYGFFNRDKVLTLVASNAEILNYPAYVAMTVAKFNGNTPPGLPGRTITDEDDNTTILKWGEWADRFGRSVVDLTDGRKGIELSDGNRYLPGTKLAALNGAAGYEFLDPSMYKALLPEPVTE